MERRVVTQGPLRRERTATRARRVLCCRSALRAAAFNVIVFMPDGDAA
jgi:hypothetical protein